MLISDLPPAEQTEVICSIDASLKYDVPASILIAVAKVENGKVNSVNYNKNGSYDIGKMQINSTYLLDLKKYGITEDMLKSDGCFPYYVAAYKIKRHLIEDKGTYWQRIANYHSRTAEYNMNYQKLGKELMSMDELAVMDGSKCIVQVRGVRPFLSDKYDLTKHPNYPLTADYDKKNWFDIEKYLNRKLVLHPNDEYEVFVDDESK